MVGSVWRVARARNLNILPLVVNLACPTPSMGWRSAEWPSFLDRANGAFDCVLMLAVLHHLLVTERVPLDEILDLAAGITTHFAIIEFIEPSDSMFKRLTRGREHLHAGLNPTVFEASCRRHFEIVRSERLPSSERTVPNRQGIGWQV